MAVYLRHAPRTEGICILSSRLMFLSCFAGHLWSWYQLEAICLSLGATGTLLLLLLLLFSSLPFCILTCQNCCTKLKLFVTLQEKAQNKNLFHIELARHPSLENRLLFLISREFTSSPWEHYFFQMLDKPFANQPGVAFIVTLTIVCFIKLVEPSWEVFFERL